MREAVDCTDLSFVEARQLNQADKRLNQQGCRWAIVERAVGKRKAFQELGRDSIEERLVSCAWVGLSRVDWLEAQD